MSAEDWLEMVQLSDDERRVVRQKAREALLEALRALGGEAQTHEIRAHALAHGGFSERELEGEPPEAANGKYATLVRHALAWEMTRLRRDGLVESPRTGRWRLAGAALETQEPLVAEEVAPSRLVELQTMRYREYLRTPEWRRVRAAALQRAGQACALDVSHTERLEVHHRTYERRGAELPEDVVVLCRECHRKHHGLDVRRSVGPPRTAAKPRKPRHAPAKKSPSLLARLLGRRAA